MRQSQGLFFTHGIEFCFAESVLYPECKFRPIGEGDRGAVLASGGGGIQEPSPPLRGSPPQEGNCRHNRHSGAGRNPVCISKLVSFFTFATLRKFCVPQNWIPRDRGMTFWYQLNSVLCYLYSVHCTLFLWCGGTTCSMGSCHLKKRELDSGIPWNRFYL